MAHEGVEPLLVSEGFDLEGVFDVAETRLGWISSSFARIEAVGVEGRTLEEEDEEEEWSGGARLQKRSVLWLVALRTL